MNLKRKNEETEFERQCALFGVKNKKHGQKGDSSGKAAEEAIINILNNKEYLQHYKQEEKIDSFDYDLFESTLMCYGIERNVQNITAIKNTMLTEDGGAEKADIVLNATYENGQVSTMAISVKQTKARTVSAAEFSPEKIIKGAHIMDEEINRLFYKFAADGSGKNFTKTEKETMIAYFEKNQHARLLIYWVLTGAFEADADLEKIPTCFIIHNTKIETSGEVSVVSVDVFSLEELIHTIMFKKDGTARKAGYHTGLSFTRPSKKNRGNVQFKIPH